MCRDCVSAGPTVMGSYDRESFGAEAFDAVVIGAGPAGLSAAASLRKAHARVAVLEMGKAVELRDRQAPVDLATGVGGAGLYSDGKFSAYPAATRLWGLEDQQSLRLAYEWLTEILAGEIPLPPFPQADRFPEEISELQVRLKEYPAWQMNLTARTHLIGDISADLGSSLKVGAHVRSLTPERQGLIVKYSDTNGRLLSIRTRTVVIAGGRFGHLLMPKWAPWAPNVFRRYEVGLRLESGIRDFFLQESPVLDPKYLIRSSTSAPRVEWRTFCTCRNGEVVATDFCGLTTLSGRADTPATERSNVGFNVRLLERPGPGSPLAGDLSDLMSGKVPTREMELGAYQAGADICGPALDELLRKGLTLLLGTSIEAGSLRVAGPCVEGVGDYPMLDANLRLASTQPVWVAGDHTGLFRGLTASFVSGYYAGLQAARWLEKADLGAFVTVS
jgi:uncharacterized protein